MHILDFITDLLMIHLNLWIAFYLVFVPYTLKIRRMATLIKSNNSE